jgi:hypothetical protein
MMENILKRFLASKIRKLERNLKEKEENILAGFSGFRVLTRCRAIPGSAVIARPAGGTMAGSGFAARWLTTALQRCYATRRDERQWPGWWRAGLVEFMTCALRKGGKEFMIGVLGNRLSSAEKVLKNTCDLAGDLLGAKTRALQKSLCSLSAMCSFVCM